MYLGTRNTRTVDELMSRLSAHRDTRQILVAANNANGAWWPQPIQIPLTIVVGHAHSTGSGNPGPGARAKRRWHVRAQGLSPLRTSRAVCDCVPVDTRPRPLNDAVPARTIHAALPTWHCRRGTVPDPYRTWPNVGDSRLPPRRTAKAPPLLQGSPRKSPTHAPSPKLLLAISRAA